MEWSEREMPVKFERLDAGDFPCMEIDRDRRGQAFTLRLIVTVHQQCGRVLEIEDCVAYNRRQAEGELESMNENQKTGVE